MSILSGLGMAVNVLLLLSFYKYSVNAARQRIEGSACFVFCLLLTVMYGLRASWLTVEHVGMLAMSLTSIANVLPFAALVPKLTRTLHFMLFSTFRDIFCFSRWRVEYLAQL